MRVALRKHRARRRRQQKRRAALYLSSALPPRYVTGALPDEDGWTPRERQLSWEAFAPVGLEAVLGVAAEGIAEFFAEVWEAEPRVYKGGCSSAWLGDLPTWGDVFGIARDCGAGGGVCGVSQALIFKDGAPSTTYASAAHGWLDACSVVVNRLDAVWEGARRLSVSLRHHLPHAYCQLYATPPGSQAVDAHADDRDVFVIQLEGRKEWVVYGDPPVVWPNPAEQAAVTRFIQ